MDIENKILEMAEEIKTKREKCELLEINGQNIVRYIKHPNFPYYGTRMSISNDHRVLGEPIREASCNNKEWLKV